MRGYANMEMTDGPAGGSVTDHAEDKVAKKGPLAGMPLWKKLTIAGIVILVVVGLAVGLGVGLTRNKGGSDDSNDDTSDDGSGDDSNYTPPSTENLWMPSVGASWQIILKYPIVLPDDGAKSLEPDVDIWDLDLYDNNATTFKSINDAGKKVICYFSAGSYEDWRSDAGEFEDADKGKNLDGWEGEKWLNLSSPNVHKIMKERIKLASEKGCDAIDPDNVDGYANDNGLGLTAKDSVAYIKFLSTEAAKYNMSTGLKNAGSIIDTVLDYVHFSVNEQCIQYGECDTFSTFIGANKPVFNIEYPDKAPKVSTSEKTTICSTSGDAADSNDFSKVIKKMNLDGWVSYCNETQTYNTTTTNSSS